MQVAESERIAGPIAILGRPIAGRHAGKFPAEPADDERIGIVFDRVHKRGEGNVLAKFLAAVLVE